jgi:hypothetical protein
MNRLSGIYLQDAIRTKELAVDKDVGMLAPYLEDRERLAAEIQRFLQRYMESLQE